MTDTIDLQISKEYRGDLNILREFFPDEEGKKVSDDSKLVELLIETLVAFVEEEAENQEG